MTARVTDTRSFGNNQIEHASKVLSRSEKMRVMFKAICGGGKNAKSVQKLSDLTGYNIMNVSQLAGKLHDYGIAHRVKINGVVCYAKDDFYKQKQKTILKYALDTDKLKKLPTSINPRGIASNLVSISLKVPRVKTKVITCDDIDQFKGCKKFKTAPKIDISESAFKEGIKKLLGETGKFQDWGGEPNDLFTTKIKLNGKRFTTAFAFKGPGTKGELTPKKLGKNGDQIQRLFAASAEIFIVQYHDQINQSVVDQMSTYATVKSIHDNKLIRYGIINGDDTNRLMAAYPRSFQGKKRKST